MGTNFRSYGDNNNVEQDSKALTDIIERQGYNFTIDCLAIYIGNVSLKHNLHQDDIKTALDSLIADLKNAVNERT